MSPVAAPASPEQSNNKRRLPSILVRRDQNSPVRGGAGSAALVPEAVEVDVGRERRVRGITGRCAAKPQWNLGGPKLKPSLPIEGIWISADYKVPHPEKSKPKRAILETYTKHGDRLWLLPGDSMENGHTIHGRTKIDATLRRLTNEVRAAL
jgi:hypothetical protein